MYIVSSLLLYYFSIFFYLKITYFFILKNYLLRFVGQPLGLFRNRIPIPEPEGLREALVHLRFEPKWTIERVERERSEYLKTFTGKKDMNYDLAATLEV